MIINFILSSARCKSSNCSITSPTFGLIGVFNFNLSYGYNISLWFNLCLPVTNDVECLFMCLLGIDIGTLHFLGLCSYCVFYKWKICGKLSPWQAFDAIFQIACDHLVFSSPTLTILAMLRNVCAIISVMISEVWWYTVIIWALMSI